MKKLKAIILGPFLGELGWEIMRFSPMLPFLKNKYPKFKFIIFTRPDRFDLYGSIADILVPLRIKNEKKYIQDCFRLTSFPNQNYKKLINAIYDKYSKNFEIVNHIYPDVSRNKFRQKNQFSKLVYDWYPRKRNKELMESYIPKDRKIIVIAPRFRKGLKRNWKYWNEFYELILNSKLNEKFNFVICGKDPDYIKSPKGFYDLNSIKLDSNSSLIGLTIEVLKKSILTIGTQSAIPNLSALLKTPVLEWGHEKKAHSKQYNKKNTKIYFFDDFKYNIKPKIIFEKMKEIVCLQS